ncbi:MAG: peptidase M4 [Methylobacterium sp.]|nr:peptidase M4 [Methylobacterium sp.]
MKKQLLTLVLSGALTSLAPAVQAAKDTPLDACVKAALASHPGKMISMSSEIEDGKSQYEIDIKGNDGNNWEVECDARTGKIIRFEREIKVNAAEFKDKAKLTEDAAIKAALDKYPGKVLNTEYDIEDDGEVSYEFIIKTDAGKTIEIEVDAVSGKLAGYEEVRYHIGE